jgi:hypothetical protein
MPLLDPTLPYVMAKSWSLFSGDREAGATGGVQLPSGLLVRPSGRPVLPVKLHPVAALKATSRATMMSYVPSDPKPRMNSMVLFGRAAAGPAVAIRTPTRALSPSHFNLRTASPL